VRRRRQWCFVTAAFRQEAEMCALAGLPLIWQDHAGAAAVTALVESIVVTPKKSVTGIAAAGRSRRSDIQTSLPGCSPSAGQ